ncbi:MAG: hypothetical protein R2820_10080 [Cyclobacteriaceae bacterium]|nr:hypothetical protein [Cyclobacteriaceae bacterium]
MHALQFWKSWARVYQRIGLVVALIFVLSLCFLWYSWLMAPAPALNWLHIQEQEQITVPAHTFQHGLLELTIPGDNYLIFERLLGSSLKPNVTAGYVFLGALAIGMVVLLTIVTVLSRFWYLLGMGLFILLIVGFRLEIINMFGMPNKVFTIITLACYIIPSFYFQFFRSSTTFRVRLLIFSVITALLAIVTSFFSGVDYPFLHLSVTGVTAGIVLSVIFILMVAHEILASFVFVASQASAQSKSLNHFLIISVIYMANLALAYLHKIGTIQWDFLYINFYLLLTISGILGVWGFRQRQPQYEGIIDADPFGTLLFLSLGIICFTTVGYFLGTANDPALATIDDAIIYGHLGYGIIFLTYIISNFISMLAKNMPVYKVLYKPNNMPYFTFRFGGLIATLAFFFYNTWQVPVQNAFSAYYNAGGDLYKVTGNSTYAEAFYQQAGTYGFLNHHSNYAVANIEGTKGNSIRERNFYDRASQLRPTEFSFLNLSQTFQREGSWLEAMLALQEARKTFDNSGPIQNTLGLVYSKLNLLDSSLFFLQRAMEDNLSREGAQTNFIGVSAKNNLNVPADSLLRLLESDNQGTRSNALAFANMQGTKVNFEFDALADTTLNLFSASLINNYVLNHLGELDSALVNKAIAIAKKPVNSDYEEAVLFASALALYENGSIGRAYSLLEEVAIRSRDQDKYNSILAMWSLEQNAPFNAGKFSDYIANQNNPQYLPVVAASLSESGRIGESLVKWDSLRNIDTTYLEVSQQMINALAASPNLVNRFSNEEKYLFTQFRIAPLDTIQFDRVLRQIDNDDIKGRAILETSRKLFEMDETDAAIVQFQKVKDLQLTDRDLYESILHFELDLLAKKGDMRSLARQINNQQINFEGKWQNQKIYFQAKLSEMSGDTIVTGNFFNWLSTANPFDEEAVIDAANFAKLHSKYRLRSYTILTDALHSNDHSIKLLKAYCLEAARMGFYEYSRSALERLRALLTPERMRQFLLDNQQTFQPVLQ